MKGEWVLSYLEAFQRTKRRSDARPLKEIGPAKVSLTNLPRYWLRVLVDAACAASSPVLGVGVAVWNGDNELQVAMAKRLEVGLEPLVAEVGAIREAMRMAEQKGFQKLVILSNCLEAIALVQGKG